MNEKQLLCVVCEPDTRLAVIQLLDRGAQATSAVNNSANDDITTSSTTDATPRGQTIDDETTLAYEHLTTGSGVRDDASSANIQYTPLTFI